MIFSDNSRKFNKLNNDLSKSKKIILDPGIYYFNLNIEYSGTDWKFDPQIVRNNSKISLFKEKNIFINFDRNNFKNLQFKNYIGSIYDFLIFLLIFIIVFEIYLIQLKYEKNNILIAIFFFISYLILDKIIDYILIILKL